MEGTQEEEEEEEEAVVVEVEGWSHPPSGCEFRGCSMHAPGRQGIPNETLISCPMSEELLRSC